MNQLINSRQEDDLPCENAPCLRDDYQSHRAGTYLEEAPDVGRSARRADEDMKYSLQRYHQNVAHKSCLKTYFDLLQQQKASKCLN